MRSQRFAEAVSHLAGLGMVLVACAPAPTPAAAPVVTHKEEPGVERDPDVPSLPFPDNPDPTQCGTPMQWGLDPASVSAHYEGELIQPSGQLQGMSRLRASLFEERSA
jgi:hypothetical protein